MLKVQILYRKELILHWKIGHYGEDMPKRTNDMSRIKQYIEVHMKGPKIGKYIKSFDAMPDEVIQSRSNCSIPI